MALNSTKKVGKICNLCPSPRFCLCICKSLPSMAHCTKPYCTKKMPMATSWIVSIPTAQRHRSQQSLISWSLSGSLSVCRSVCLAVSPSICLPVCPSKHLSVSERHFDWFMSKWSVSKTTFHMSDIQISATKIVKRFSSIWGLEWERALKGGYTANFFNNIRWISILTLCPFADELVNLNWEHFYVQRFVVKQDSHSQSETLQIASKTPENISNTDQKLISFYCDADKKILNYICPSSLF